jgi:uncharacterized protein (UPF0332 family)
MKFNWVNYLTLAKNLLINQSNNSSEIIEAELRSSISRSYYAAFHVAKKYLYKVRSYELSKENSHRSLIDEFKYSGDPRLSIIGNYLERLRDRRNEADYDDIVLNLRKNAEQSAKFSQIVIDRLDAD